MDTKAEDRAVASVSLGLRNAVDTRHVRKGVGVGGHVRV